MHGVALTMLKVTFKQRINVTERCDRTSLPRDETAGSAPAVPLSPYGGGHNKCRHDHDENNSLKTHHDASPKASRLKNTAGLAVIP
jgi:hypothetical protein